MNRSGVAASCTHARRNEEAVSEVLGVVMLLAMVITIMGGVWIFLNPYLSDFEDNTNWKSATGLADRIEDRVQVAGNAPNGTGFRNTLSLQSTSLRGVQNIEQWHIAADLTTQDEIIINLVNSSAISVLSSHEIARGVVIESSTTNEFFQFPASHEAVILNHNATQQEWIVMTVLDADGQPLHRMVTLSLSGISITTSLGLGEHEIILMNNARAERFPNEAWDISHMPSVEFDRLANNELRLSMLVTDIVVDGALGSGISTGIEFVSMGPKELFSGHAYNVRFKVTNALHDVITPQYYETWLTQYTLERSSGTLDSYIGFAPYARASGADGMTVQSQDLPFFFEVDLQRVEVSK